MFDLGRIPEAGSVTEELMPRQPDGVRVVGFRIAADNAADGIPAAGGQYYLVCSGALLQGGKVLPPSSLIRVEPGEPTPSLKAGGEGAEVMVVQFANPSDRLGSDPSKLAHRQGGYFTRQKEGT